MYRFKNDFKKFIIYFTWVKKHTLRIRSSNKVVKQNAYQWGSDFQQHYITVEPISADALCGKTVSRRLQFACSEKGNRSRYQNVQSNESHQSGQHFPGVTSCSHEIFKRPEYGIVSVDANKEQHVAVSRIWPIENDVPRRPEARPFGCQNEC